VDSVPASIVVTLNLRRGEAGFFLFFDGGIVFGG
jgi:hypothetical protein